MDSAAQNQDSQGPSLCAGGCGFYGSSDTNGFCSVCYKAHQSAALAATSSPSAPAAAVAAAAVAATPAAEPKLAMAAPQPAEEAASSAAATATQPAQPSEPAGDKPVQENRGRCFCCRKKIGLLGFECRCGYVFCSGHRHAQDHACSFDYATFDKANLAKVNTKVVAAKVDKL